jgi:hypothetical protein
VHALRGTLQRHCRPARTRRLPAGSILPGSKRNRSTFNVLGKENKIMSTEQNTLLASSPSIDGIISMVNDYFYSQCYALRKKDDKNYTIFHTTRGDLNRFVVVKSKGRYRFEQTVKA